MYSVSITSEEIGKLPLAACPGKIHVIEEPGPALDSAVRFLRRQRVLGFDTETRPTFMPGQPRCEVALLQLSAGDQAFLFRLNKLGLTKSLCNILANPSILKIGAAVHDDIRGLQRLHGFQAAGFVDLQKIGWEYGIRDKSVKKMAGIILGVRISKTQQLSNWEADSLSDGQALYAATDAWVCQMMYAKLLASEKHPLTEEQLHPELYEKQASLDD